MTLIAEGPTLRVADGFAAFATPTIVHFGVVLLLSAVVSVPWHKIGPISGSRNASLPDDLLSPSEGRIYFASERR